MKALLFFLRNMRFSAPSCKWLCVYVPVVEVSAMTVTSVDQNVMGEWFMFERSFPSATHTHTDTARFVLRSCLTLVYIITLVACLTPLLNMFIVSGNSGTIFKFNASWICSTLIQDFFFASTERVGSKLSTFVLYSGSPGFQTRLWEWHY
jgi:hypothetical protein